MSTKNQRRTAITAAAAYFGLSKSPTSFPRSVRVSVLDGKPCRLGAFEALDGRLKEAWRDNIGPLSRTARLGERDVAAILKELGQTVPPERIPDLMLGIADAHPSVLAVEVEHQGVVRLIVVNTAMSA